jgi:hypothetical protein
MHAGNSETGGKTVHFSSPSQQTTLVPESTPPNSETTSTTACSAVVNDKYFLCNHLNWVDESHEFTHFLEQVHYFEDMSKCSENCQSVKGSLTRHVAYWEKIGASSFVLDTIKNGYIIPFIEPPIQMCFKNNRSALGNEEFVSQTISDLIKSGCVVQVPFQPFVVNPLLRYVEPYFPLVVFSFRRRCRPQRRWIHTRVLCPSQRGKSQQYGSTCFGL